MGLNERVREMLALAAGRGEPAVPDGLQGVNKARIAAVLEALDLSTVDRVDAVFSLLDDRASWFTRTTPGTRFCDGATIAHIASHVGILQRDGVKLDREGRDYWIKPLRSIGAVEAVMFDRRSGSFLPGHPIAKSSNSAYRLAEDFVSVLKAPEAEWRALLATWNSKDSIRRRLEFQATLAAETLGKVDRKHADLIRACCEEYAPRFLAGFEVVFVDDSDGDRVDDDDRARLEHAGLRIKLDDPMPDVLLHNRETDELWVIEAVTSDGEVDEHKVRSLLAFAARNGKDTVSFTTAYPSWRLAAQRQAKHKNVAPGTYIWIREDASKHYRSASFES